MNLSLRPAVILAILLGLLLPATINGYMSIRSDLAQAEQSIREDHERLLDILVLGMQEPLWNLAPESGKPLLDSVMSDARVVRILVNDASLGIFLSKNKPDRRLGKILSLSHLVSKQGNVIGNVTLELDDGIAKQNIERKQQQYLIAVAIQVCFSLGLILFLLNSRVLRPLETLTKQSQQLANNQLDREFIWLRPDEIGQLGRSLEQTRQSLKQLIGTLEQKNLQLEADLMSRQQIELALRVSEDRMRRLVESTRLIPWDARPEEWRFTYVGPQAEQLLNYPLSVWYSEGFLSSYLHPDDRHFAYPLFADVHEPGQVYEFECRLLAANGKEVWVQIMATCDLDQTGRPHLQGYLFDISNRKFNESQLEDYRHHLEEVVEERSRELANSTHELEILTNILAQDLRNPLRTIDGFSQVLIDDYQDHLDNNARNYLQRIRSSINGMASRIDDLLMLQQLSRAELRPQTLDLSVMAHDIAEEITILQPNRSHHIDISPDLLADADPRLIRIALFNLIENAWKYSQSKETIKITFASTHVNGQLVFYIADEGIGFNMIQAKNLFTPFYRLHSQAQYSGNGIGLTVTQRIISRHGGRIWAKSAPDEGTIFYFTLPSHHGQPLQN
ncbi:PAS domain-containing protein [Chitinibacter bivalviorum]|uniref:histidine kinase n=1 Tax=Chitinibacter bivalviorum TaxID=2739434 RepID=A0A7H9BHB8_9NEIS|nr:ATP-binding protein [Chitinibacter bivalviorum]QLG87351.1 PAS domain-containing protein [Chitinibacter bivalviorum]